MKRFNMEKGAAHNDILAQPINKDAEEEAESFERAIGKNLGTEFWQ